MVLAHVLFDGEIRRHPALRSLFWKLGVTVGSMPAGSPENVRATVEDCDAVVTFGREGEPAGGVSGAMPDGAEEEGVAVAAAAPLLVIGAGQAAAEPWVRIPDAGPGGSRLKAALQSCQEQARLLRGDPISRHDQDQFRDFLGHELRSPLTAIQTALTVLDSDGPADPGSARMLGIARRNLVRLAETVEWSQELMSLAESPPAPDLAPVSVAELAAVIPTRFEVQQEAPEGNCEVLTDSRLLGLLAVQMERVLAHACPGRRTVFRIVLDPRGDECRFSATAPADRSHRSGQDEEDLSLGRLDRLARMLISPHLRLALVVRPRLRVDAAGGMELTIGLPLYTRTCSLEPEPQFTA